MKISARNQIRGEVEYIELGKVNASVFVKLKSGYSLISVITHHAVGNLSLEIGDEVTAFFKSSSVLVTTDPTIQISARNKFLGNIADMTQGDVNTELLIDIGNDTIAAVINNEAVKQLQLKKGDALSAVIKASDILLGIEKDKTQISFHNA